MVRTQIQLTDAQAQFLHDMAAREGVSIAEFNPPIGGSFPSKINPKIAIMNELKTPKKPLGNTTPESRI